MKERQKIDDLMYGYLSRKRRPFREEDNIFRIEGNRFKLVTVKYTIYFYPDEKDVLHIVDIKENSCN